MSGLANDKHVSPRFAVHGPTCAIMLAQSGCAGMSATEPGGPVVEIVRYQLARVRMAQACVPLVMLASLLSRAVGGIVTYVAVALISAAVASFALARRSFGRQPLRVVRGKIQFPEGPPVVPALMERWTMSGPIARLYGKGISWRLVCAPGDEDRLRTSLALALGPPLLLGYRGSRRARMVA